MNYNFCHILKKKTFALLVLWLVSCHSTYELHTETYKGKEILVGKAAKSDLEKKPYNEWFDANYRDYRPDANIIEKLKPVINNYDFRVILGTWCGDSQEQVPVLYQSFATSRLQEKSRKCIGPLGNYKILNPTRAIKQRGLFGTYHLLGFKKREKERGRPSFENPMG